MRSKRQASWLPAGGSGTDGLSASVTAGSRQTKRGRWGSMYGRDWAVFHKWLRHRWGLICECRAVNLLSENVLMYSPEPNITSADKAQLSAQPWVRKVSDHFKPHFDALGICSCEWIYTHYMILKAKDILKMTLHLHTDNLVQLWENERVLKPCKRQHEKSIHNILCILLSVFSWKMM